MRNAINKPIVHYTYLGNVVLKGGNATIVPVDHWIALFNHERLLVGPVITVIERINDSRPIFETASAVYIPSDVDSVAFITF